MTVEEFASVRPLPGFHVTRTRTFIVDNHGQVYLLAAPGHRAMLQRVEELPADAEPTRAIDEPDLWMMARAALSLGRGGELSAVSIADYYAWRSRLFRVHAGRVFELRRDGGVRFEAVAALPAGAVPFTEAESNSSKMISTTRPVASCMSDAPGQRRSLHAAYAAAIPLRPTWPGPKSATWPSPRHPPSAVIRGPDSKQRTEPNSSPTSRRNQMSPLRQQPGSCHIARVYSPALLHDGVSAADSPGDARSWPSLRSLVASSPMPRALATAVAAVLATSCGGGPSGHEQTTPGITSISASESTAGSSTTSASSSSTTSAAESTGAAASSTGSAPPVSTAR